MEHKTSPFEGYATGLTEATACGALERISLEVQEKAWVEGINNFPEINRKKMEFSKTQEEINNTPSDVRGNYSDGYHTFNELYEFRKVYNAALFNVWATQKGFDDGVNFYHELPKYNVHKSWKHHDGGLCFEGGWFIVSAKLPTGQISNHYEAKDWDLFKIPETDKALFEFDGHTSQQVLERLMAL